MNELLGWFGYEEVDKQETDRLQIDCFASIVVDSATVEATTEIPEVELPRAISRDNASPVDSDDIKRGAESAIGDSKRSSTVEERRHEPSTEGLAPRSVDNDGQCIWCHRTVTELVAVNGAAGNHGCRDSSVVDDSSREGDISEHAPQSWVGERFCSERCFTQCRRASYKLQKVCNWCKQSRHSVDSVDFQEGDQQLQFCGDTCLNQFKMNIFCKETEENLKHAKEFVETASTLLPQSQKQQQLSVSSSSSAGVIVDGETPVLLITPDLWLSNNHQKGSKTKSDDKTLLTSTILDSVSKASKKLGRVRTISEEDYFDNLDVALLSNGENDSKRKAQSISPSSTSSQRKHNWGSSENKLHSSRSTSVANYNPMTGISGNSTTPISKISPVGKSSGHQAGSQPPSTLLDLAKFYPSALSTLFHPPTTNLWCPSEFSVSALPFYNPLLIQSLFNLRAPKVEAPESGPAFGSNGGRTSMEGNLLSVRNQTEQLIPTSHHRQRNSSGSPAHDLSSGMGVSPAVKVDGAYCFRTATPSHEIAQPSLLLPHRQPSAKSQQHDQKPQQPSLFPFLQAAENFPGGMPTNSSFPVKLQPPTLFNPSLPSLMPPSTLLVPYPFLLPLPIPIPIPIPIPVDKLAELVREGGIGSSFENTAKSEQKNATRRSSTVEEVFVDRSSSSTTINVGISSSPISMKDGTLGGTSHSPTIGSVGGGSTCWDTGARITCACCQQNSEHNKVVSIKQESDIKTGKSMQRAIAGSSDFDENQAIDLSSKKRLVEGSLKRKVAAPLSPISPCSSAKFCLKSAIPMTSSGVKSSHYSSSAVDDSKVPSLQQQFANSSSLLDSAPSDMIFPGSLIARHLARRSLILDAPPSNNGLMTAGSQTTRAGVAVGHGAGSSRKTSPGPPLLQALKICVQGEARGGDRTALSADGGSSSGFNGGRKRFGAKSRVRAK